MILAYDETQYCLTERDIAGIKWETYHVRGNQTLIKSIDKIWMNVQKMQTIYDINPLVIQNCINVLQLAQ